MNRERALAEAAAVVAEELRESRKLTPIEAARRAWSPGRPPVEVMAQQIEAARRGGTASTPVTSLIEQDAHGGEPIDRDTHIGQHRDQHASDGERYREYVSAAIAVATLVSMRDRINTDPNHPGDRGPAADLARDRMQDECLQRFRDAQESFLAGVNL